MAVVYRWELNGGIKGYIIDPKRITIKGEEIVRAGETEDKDLQPLIVKDNLPQSEEELVKAWVDTIDLNVEKDKNAYRTCFKRLVSNENVQRGGNAFLSVEDYLNTPESCDNLVGPAGPHIEKIEIAPEQIKDYEDVEKIKYIATLSDRRKTQIPFEIPRGPKGDAGHNGIDASYRLDVSAYIVLRDGYVPEQPGNLNSDKGTYDWMSDELTYPELIIEGEDTLPSDAFPDFVIKERWGEAENRPEGFNVWCSYATFGKDSEGKTILRKNWSIPYRVNGDGGENGKDGESIQFLFKRVASSDVEAKPEFSEAGELGKTENIQKYGWSDSPEGITSKYKLEWMIQQVKLSTGDWSNWTAPVVWSRWGEDGKDGDGIEYIYRLTKKGENPLLEGDLFVDPETDKKYAFSQDRYDKMENYQMNEFIPERTEEEKALEMKEWTDNPTRGENPLYDMEWVCVRKRKTDADGNQVWGKFSYPSVWSEKGEPGTTGDMGPSGLPGVGYTVRYHWGDETGPKNIKEGKLVPAELNREKVNIEDDKGNGWFKDTDLFEQEKIDMEKLFPDAKRECIWIVQARCVSEVKMQNGEPVISDTFEKGEKWFGPTRVNGLKGIQGDPGKRAPIIYSCGVYSPDKAYTVRNGKAPYVYDPKDGNYYIFNQEYDGTDPHHIWYGGKKEDEDGTTYTVKIDEEEISGVPSRYGVTPSGCKDDTSLNDYWEKMEQFEALYTKVGIIANGLIGESVFNNEFMFSQRGVDKDGNVTTHYEKFRDAYEYDEDTRLYYRDGVLVGKNEFMPVLKDDTDVFLTSDGFTPSACIEISEGKVPYEKFSKEIFSRYGDWKVGNKVLIGLKCHEYPIYYVSDVNEKKYKLQFTGKYRDVEGKVNLSVYEDQNEYPVVEYFAEANTLTGDETMWYYAMTPEGKAILNELPKFDKTTFKKGDSVPGPSEGKFFLNYYDIMGETSAKPRDNYESWVCDKDNIKRYGLIPGSPDPYLKVDGKFANSFTPNFCLNFKNGEAWFAGGNIHMDGDGHTSIDGTLAMRNNGNITSFLNGSGDITRVPKNNLELDDEKIKNSDGLANQEDKIIFASGISGLHGSLGDKKNISLRERKYYVWEIITTNDSASLAVLGDGIKDSDQIILTDKPYGQNKKVGDDINSFYDCGDSDTRYEGNRVYDAYIENPLNSGKVYQINDVTLTNVKKEGTRTSDGVVKDREWYGRLHLLRKFRTDDGTIIPAIYAPKMTDLQTDKEAQVTVSIKEDPISQANTLIFENGCLQTTALWAYDGFFGGELSATGYINGTANLKDSQINNSKINDSILSGSVKCGRKDNISILGDTGVILDAGNRALSSGVSNNVTTPTVIKTSGKNSSLSKWMTKGGGSSRTTYIGSISVNAGCEVSLGVLNIKSSIYAANRKWFSSDKSINPKTYIKVVCTFKRDSDKDETNLFTTGSNVRHIPDIKDADPDGAGKNIITNNYEPNGNWVSYNASIDLDACILKTGKITENGVEIKVFEANEDGKNIWKYEKSGLLTVKVSWLVDVPPNQPFDKSYYEITVWPSKNFEVKNKSRSFSEIGNNGFNLVSFDQTKIKPTSYCINKEYADTITFKEGTIVMTMDDKKIWKADSKGKLSEEIVTKSASVSAINGVITLLSGKNGLGIDDGGVYLIKNGEKGAYLQ